MIRSHSLAVGANKADLGMIPVYDLELSTTLTTNCLESEVIIPTRKKLEQNHQNHQKNENLVCF